MGLLAIIEIIGGVLGSLLTIITFIGVISKKPREMFRKAIRDESASANQPLVEKLDKIEKRMDQSDITDQTIIRDIITHIYVKYQDKKKIPHYEKENLLSLFEQYKKLKGNSYIKQLMEEIKGWEEEF